MNNKTQNGFLTLEFLSNTELYYSETVDDDLIFLEEEEFNHACKVMRHKEGDDLFVTKGNGIIFKTKVDEIFKDKYQLRIESQNKYENKFENVFFCLPIIKSPDRFSFMIEKSVELGITNFLIINFDRNVKKNIKPARINKILISAMKQSLRAFLPKLVSEVDLENLIAKKESEFYLLDQNAKKVFSENKIDLNRPSYFIFGPEGGLSEKEMDLLKDIQKYKISDYRLRSETAVVSLASQLK